ncbi:MAG: hypothetical protein WC521_05560 [Bdellovibrionales bacterium]|jgi:hypothetical protein
MGQGNGARKMLDQELDREATGFGPYTAVVGEAYPEFMRGSGNASVMSKYQIQPEQANEASPEAENENKAMIEDTTPEPSKGKTKKEDLLQGDDNEDEPAPKKAKEVEDKNDPIRDEVKKFLTAAGRTAESYYAQMKEGGAKNSVGAPEPMTPQGPSSLKGKKMSAANTANVLAM